MSWMDRTEDKVVVSDGQGTARGVMGWPAPPPLFHKRRASARPERQRSSAVPLRRRPATPKERRVRDLLSRLLLAVTVAGALALDLALVWFLASLVA